VVNVDGYYDGLLTQLAHAKKTGLLFRGALIQSEPTAKSALTFCAEHALAGQPTLTTTKAAQEEKSLFKIAKALAMLPVILVCYTSLFFMTVNMLMAWGGEMSDTGPSKMHTTLPWSVEFFGLIAILLLACKNLK